MDVAVRRVIPLRRVSGTASRSTDFAEAKQRTARQVMAQFGPTAGALCMRIEAGAATGEFVAAQAPAVVRDIRGAARAAEFGDLIEGLLAQLPARAG